MKLVNCNKILGQFADENYIAIPESEEKRDFFRIFSFSTKIFTDGPFDSNVSFLTIIFVNRVETNPGLYSNQKLEYIPIAIFFKPKSSTYSTSASRFCG